MRKLLALALIALVSLSAAALLHSSPHASARGMVWATPSRGSQYTTFEFDGDGWVPGERIHISFEDPNGYTYWFTSSRYGGDYTLVHDDGTFAVTMVPNGFMDGSPFGTYTAHFYTDRDTTASVDFVVSR